MDIDMVVFVLNFGCVYASEQASKQESKQASKRN